MDYPDNCVENASKRIAGVEPDMSADKVQFELYPNPNNGQMQISYELKENEIGMFRVFDLTGKEVISLPLMKGKNTREFREETLMSGVYYYSVIVSGQVLKTDKLVIIK